MKKLLNNILQNHVLTRYFLFLSRKSLLIALISSYRVYLFGNRSTMLATVTAAKA